MYEQIIQFLTVNIVKFGSYGISILDIILIVPIIFADFIVLKLINRFMKKKKLLEKGLVRTITRIFKWIVHFLAFLGLMRIIGVRVENIFDFLGAVLNYKLFHISDTDISLLTIIIMIVVVWVSTKLSKLARNYFDRTVFPRFKIEEGLRFSLSKIIGYLIIALGIIIALQGLGIKLSALAVFAGFLGVGIGFGMQNVVANIVSGMIILFERPIKEGDMVRLKNTVGFVRKINLRSSIIRTIYNEHLIVPNSEFINGIVENMSYEDLKLRVSIKVGVAYGTDPVLVKDSLIEAAHKTENVLEFPLPVVLFRDFGESALDFELLAWIADPSQRFNIESNLRYSIVEEFKQKDITIAFPQRDIWIRSVPKNT